MTAFEQDRHAPLDLHKLWFYGAAVLSLFFVVTTLMRPLSPNLLGFFDLDREGNIATLWSGMLMLLVGLHALDGWFGQRQANPGLARAWFALAAIMVALSFDEVGELHERAPAIGGLSTWWTLLPFGLVMLGLLLYLLQGLYRAPGQRHVFWLVVIGFLLIASVPLQVRIEATHEWPGYLKRLRAGVEEGVELLAMLLLLKAALPNTKGLFAKGLAAARPTGFPIFEALVSYRLAILLLALPAAFVLAAISPHLEPSHLNKQGGVPTAWLASSLFFMGALAVLRPSLRGDDGQPHWSVHWTSVALVLLAGLASATAMLSVASTTALALMSGLMLLAPLVWICAPRAAPSGHLPAGIFMLAVLIAAWGLWGNAVMEHLTAPLLALGFFYGCTAGQRANPSA